MAVYDQSEISFFYLSSNIAMATIFLLVLFTELIIFSTPVASGAARWAKIGLYSASSSICI